MYEGIYLTPMVLVWSITAVVGGVVGYLALRVWSRERTSSMAILGSGFVVLSVGSATTWWALYALGTGLYWCDMASTGVLALGLGVVGYSISARAA